MHATGWAAELSELRSALRASDRDLELRAAAILQDALAEMTPANRHDCLRRMLSAGRRVIAARPASARIVVLVNDMLREAIRASDANGMRLRALEVLAGRSETRAAADRALARTAGPVLGRYTAVLACSPGDALRESLSEAWKIRSELMVLCGEGRPSLGGVSLAHALGTAGVRTTVGPDLALPSWLPTADALAVEVAGIGTTGLVVGIGVPALLAAASDRDIPRIGLVPAGCLLPAGYNLPIEEAFGDPEEIMPATPNVLVRNPTLETGPLTLLSHVVTEEGPLDRPAFEEKARAVVLVPGLIGAPSRATHQENAAHG